ncbi:MAG: UDP-N-acetylglucosamine--N-acetylmuramyl-(pentapeptide) pyrophosphoryl-undecaprenol N-acetylglucosamine transferase [Patescibacteria group bacterium]
MAKRILLVGGGSGGHAYPLIAVGRALRDQSKIRGTPVELCIFGEGGLLKTAAENEGIDFKKISAGKFRRYFSLLAPFDAIKSLVGLIQSLWSVLWFMPDAVFSKGGYDAVMPCFSAWLYRIPVYTHESDTVPGLANKIIARLSKVVFVGFKSSVEQFKSGKAITVGNPVRAELLNGDRSAALLSFTLSPERKTIFVMGGSQGAQEINNIILESVVELVAQYNVIHQCGQSQYKSVFTEIEKITKEGEGEYGSNLKQNYRLFPFLDAGQMALAYAASDVIVSRAGSGSLFEIASLGKPGIVIPLASAANNHQLANAIEFAKFGGVMIEGINITPHILMNQISALLDPARYAQVSQQIRQFATPNAATDIATTILDATV